MNSMKNFFLTDEEIQDCITEPKKMNCSMDSLLKNMKVKKGRSSSMSQNTVRFPRQNGDGDWQIYLRQSKENALDFSCGIAFIPKGRNQAFNIKRYNGKSHEHTNKLEEEPPFYDFHIHQTTEKYQKSSCQNDCYAVPTDRYTDLRGALKCLLTDCQVETGESKDSHQMEMFS